MMGGPSLSAPVTLDIQEERRELVSRLRKFGRPQGRSELQAYVGSPYPVLGLTVPEMRSVLREFRAAHRRLDPSELNALASAMWSGPTYEEKAFAIALLDSYERILDDASWRLADSWIDAATGWALSDSLASGPLASMVRAKPARFRAILRWTRAKNFWRRRAATYAMHDFVLAGELAKPFEVLERLLYDEEFWVQRAVGTWLRESWKKDRRQTEAFLRKHVRGLPKVVITVATERAPRSFREELRLNR